MHTKKGPKQKKTLTKIISKITNQRKSYWKNCNLAKKIVRIQTHDLYIEILALQLLPHTSTTINGWTKPVYKGMHMLNGLGVHNAVLVNIPASFLILFTLQAANDSS